MGKYTGGEAGLGLRHNGARGVSCRSCVLSGRGPCLATQSVEAALPNDEKCTKSTWGGGDKDEPSVLLRT